MRLQSKGMLLVCRCQARGGIWLGELSATGSAVWHQPVTIFDPVWLQSSDMAAVTNVAHVLAELQVF